MKKRIRFSLRKQFLLLAGLLYSLITFSQTGCPSVVATGGTNTCPGTCVTLNSTLQATLGTSNYTVAAIPYAPFSFTSGTTVLLGIDDHFTAVIPIPFNFCFYGQTYNQCVIGANGDVTFDLTQANQTDPWSQGSGPAPNSSYPTNIMCPYHDIDPALGGTITWAVYGTAPCRQFVINWNQVPMFSCTTEIATQQCVFNETTNYVDMYIENKPLCSAWNNGAAILGIQNTAYNATVCVPGRNGTQWTASNEGWRFSPSGAPGYTFHWSNGAVNLGSTPSISVCPATTTTYTATLVNTNCDGQVVTLNSTTTVTVSGSALTLTPDTSHICAGGNVTLIASGASTYSWSPSATLNTSTGSTVIASPTSSTTYTVTGTSAGCTTTATATVFYGAPVVSVTPVSSTICPGQSVLLTASGANTYTWSPATGLNTTTGNAVTANPGTGTTYTVIGSTGTCSASATTTVTTASLPILTNSHTNVSCTGAPGTATVAASGGSTPYTYSWSPSGGTGPAAGGLSSGTYTVLVTTSSGCTASATDTIKKPPTLTLNVAGITANCKGSCDGQLICIPAGGSVPYTFSWSTGCSAPSCNNVCAGNYSVTITDANGCTVSGNTTVAEPTAVLVTLTSTSNHCNLADGADSVFVSGGSGPYSYSWSPGAGSNTNIYPNLNSGTYTVTVHDSRNCVASASNSVANNTPPVTLSLLSSINVSCFGGNDGSAITTVSGGTGPYQYSWSPQPGNTNSITNALAGIYTCTATDSYGCSGQLPVTLTQPAPLTIVPMSSVLICVGQSTPLTATASGGTTAYTFSWVNPASVQVFSPVSPSVSTSYTVYASDANGCKSNPQPVQVNVRPGLEVTPPANAAVCPGGSALLQAVVAGGDSQFVFTWLPSTGLSNSSISNPLATPTSTTTYTVIVNDMCQTPADSAFVTVSVFTPPVINFSARDTTGCMPLCTDFTSSSNPACQSAVWKFGDGSSTTGCNTVHHCYPNAGSYDVTLTVTDVNACINTLTKPAYIVVNPLPVAAFTATPNSTSIVNPQVIFTSSSTGANRYLWSFGDLAGASDTLPNTQYTYKDTGCYQVTLFVQNRFGCKDSTSSPICILPEFTFYAPNAFTPNGDGVNDVWVPKGIGFQREHYTLDVFDRWGNQLYESTVWDEGWDGKANHGIYISQVDTYVWAVHVTDFQGNKHVFTGMVNLLK